MWYHLIGLKGPFKERLVKQKAELHRKAGASEAVISYFDTGIKVSKKLSLCPRET
jgi:hypothetical protein